MSRHTTLPAMLGERSTPVARSLIGGACLAVVLLGWAAEGRAQPAGCISDRETITQQRGIIFQEANVQPGDWYWKLVEATWCEPDPGGGRINIFYCAKDAGGNFIANQPCFAGWPHSYPNPPANQVQIMTKAPTAQFPDEWGDFPMAGGSWCPSWPEGGHGPYSAWVAGQCPANGSACPPQGNYPSDHVWGMGLPCNYHESYFLVWQFTQAEGPAGPQISRSPAGFTRSIMQGQTLANDSFTVGNSGSDTLTYTIGVDAGWLSVDPPGGSSTGPANTHAILYDTTSLTPSGSPYTATVTITDPNATNNPETLAVTLEVSPLEIPGDFDGDGDVDMQDFGRFQACLTGTGNAQNDPDCARALLDDDFDVDATDTALFLDCLSGAGIPADPDCAG